MWIAKSETYDTYMAIPGKASYILHQKGVERPVKSVWQITLSP